MEAVCSFARGGGAGHSEEALIFLIRLFSGQFHRRGHRSEAICPKPQSSGSLSTDPLSAVLWGDKSGGRPSGQSGVGTPWAPCHQRSGSTPPAPPDLPRPFPVPPKGGAAGGLDEGLRPGPGWGVSSSCVPVAARPLLSAQVQGGVWLLSPRLCDALMAMDVMLCTASIFNLCAISVDRWAAQHPPRSIPARPAPSPLAPPPPLSPPP